MKEERQDEGRAGPLCKLALAAQKGDRPALEQFALSICGYVLWAVRVRRAARKKRPHGVEDGDLAAVAWIAILENLPRLEVRSDSQLKAWLRRVVMTRASDVEASGRAAKRDPTRAESLDRLMRAGDDATPAVLQTSASRHLEELHHRAELREVLAAIARLDEPLAETLWIVDLDGCGFREAGRLLDEDESTIRRRYGRAKAELAALLSRRKDS